MIEAEPQGHDSDKPEQGSVTQEPVNQELLVQAAEEGREESGMEDTLEPNEVLCTVTPECSQDAELIQEEEVIQDVVTQEPTSLGIAAESPEFQLRDDLAVDIVPDIQWSEDEQSLASSDTEILEEELHDGEDIQSQR